MSKRPKKKLKATKKAEKLAHEIDTQLMKMNYTPSRHHDVYVHNTRTGTQDDPKTSRTIKGLSSPIYYAIRVYNTRKKLKYLMENYISSSHL